MSLIAIRTVEQPLDFGRLRALVIDDYSGMRSALKMTLSNFGMSKIDLAMSAAETIFKVRNSSYDILLCDFNLGDGRDGQQLLEELRPRGMIQLKTVFIMVTAESVYEKVAATAELAPDDYLIKPFSAEVIHNRLENILRRKMAFARVYQSYEEGNLEAAIAGCDQLMREHPKYLVDALRFKGETLNAQGRFEEAEALYRQVIEMRAIPWARLGLSKALHLQKKNEEAEEHLRDVLENSPELVAAYDLLAEVRLANKDSVGAQAALQAGVAISSRTVRRQQKLGNLAMDNQDLDTAHAAYSAAIEKGQHSVFITPADYANLCRAQVEQGNLNGALDTLKKARLTLQSDREGQLVNAVVQTLVHTRAGRGEEARRALDDALRLRGDGARVDGALMLDLADTCLAQGRNQEADAIIGEVARNGHDSETLLAKVLAAATSDVRKLNNDGVLQAHKGNFKAAVTSLLAACRMAPFNPRILMNGIWVILKSIEQEGMDEALLDQARNLLAEAERQSPGHSRITGLRAHLKDIETGFGIRRKTA
jgi:DNA-binding response OmpR family regulator/Tfp pilus assembly protein PilF